MSALDLPPMNPPPPIDSASPLDTTGFRRIAVMNPKGGCGKTTLATNLASRYATGGLAPALFDYDPLGASVRWLRSRPAARPSVHGVSAHGNGQSGVTRSWQLRVPAGTQRIIHDTPAGLERLQILERIEGLDAILVPVLPSPMDISATADFIRDLLLVGKLRSRRIRVGIVPNRVKSNTLAFRALERFLGTLEIPIVGQVRDTQNYVAAAQAGVGIHELPRQRDPRDTKCWSHIVDWLEAGWPQARPDTQGTVADGSRRSLASGLEYSSRAGNH